MSDLPSHQIVAGGSRDMKIALRSPPVAQFECSDVRNLPGGKEGTYRSPVRDKLDFWIVDQHCHHILF